MRARQFLFAIALMLSGGVLTLAIEHASQRHHGPHSQLHQSHLQMLNELEEELHLNGAQLDSINAIFKRHQVAVDLAWRQIHMNMSAALDSVHTEIGQVLDSSQLRQFHQFLRSHTRP